MEAMFKFGIMHAKFTLFNVDHTLRSLEVCQNVEARCADPEGPRRYLGQQELVGGASAANHLSTFSAVVLKWQFCFYRMHEHFLFK